MDCPPGPETSPGQACFRGHDETHIIWQLLMTSRIKAQGANCTAGNRIRVAQLIYSPKVGGSEMLAAEILGRLDRSLFDPICIMLFPGSGQGPTQNAVGMSGTEIGASFRLDMLTA